jgi:hypothetical protein
VAVDDGAFIDTSFPGFADFMRALGADIRRTGEFQMAGGGTLGGGGPGGGAQAGGTVT